MRETFAMRIRSLDGLRGLSILAVVVGHVAGTNGAPAFLHAADRAGNLGVRMFFVISGFLITSLLAREIERTGTISVRNFYVRRAFRIFPAFYAYVGCIAALSAIGVVHLLPKDLLYASVFAMNYLPDRSWELNHTWSLAVEEQFYLLWPLLFLLCKRRRATHLAVAVMLVVPVVRAVMWCCLGASDTAMNREFQAIADALAAGALLACLLPEVVSRPALLARARAAYVPALALLLILAAFWSYRYSRALFYVGGQSVADVAIALFLLNSVTRNHGLIDALLNVRWLVWVGRVSYSLYLWQELFLDPSHDLWYTRYPLNLALALVAAIGSHYLIEQPLLRLRDRLPPRLGGAGLAT